MQNLLTAKEAGAMLGIRVSTLYDWVYKKKIEHVKVGRLLKFRREVLEKYIEENTVAIRP